MNGYGGKVRSYDPDADEGGHGAGGRGGNRKAYPRVVPPHLQDYPIRGIERSLIAALGGLAKADDRSVNKYIIKVLREHVKAMHDMDTE